MREAGTTPSWYLNEDVGAINNQFGSLQKNLEAYATARGFGNSGKLNMNVAGLQTNRVGAIGQSRLGKRNRWFDIFKQDRQNLMSELRAFQVPYNFRQTGTATGQQSGGIGQGIAGATSDIASYLMYRDMMKAPQAAPSSPLTAIGGQIGAGLTQAAGSFGIT